MRRLLALAALVLAAGCASAPRPGPTFDGLAVAVAARDKAGARREALQSVLPLFLSDTARVRDAAAIDAALLAKPERFIGKQALPKKKKPGPGVVEVLLDPLSEALQKAGLTHPPGYRSGPEAVLLAFGDRAAGPTPLEHFSAEAFETALFAHGIQAHDIDDDMVQMQTPIKAKTEEATALAATAAGWAWLAAGRVAGEAERAEIKGDARSAPSWRAKATMKLALYAAGKDEPERLEGAGEALDVSTSAAVSHAVEQAAQDAAVRVEGVLSRGRAGRSILTVVLAGYKDPALLRRVLKDLRAVPEVEAAALVLWHGEDEAAVVHAYALGLTVDKLAGKLMNADPDLRIVGIETSDATLSVEGPMVPESSDQGQGDN